MRRRRADHMPRRRKVVWTSNDREELLANLDVVIQAHGESISKDLVLKKLKARIGHPGRTVEQIANKLNRERKTIKTTFHDVLRNGTRCLQLSDHTRLRVRERAAAIRIKDQEIFTLTPRTLRSASRTPGMAVERLESGPTKPRIRQPNFGRGKALQTCVADSFESVPNGSVYFGPGSAVRFPLQVMPTPAVVDLLSSQFMGLVDQDGHRTRPATDPPGMGKVSFLWTQVPNAPGVDCNDPEVLPQFTASEITNRILDTVRDLLSDNMYLHNKLEQSDARCKQLEEKDRCRYGLGTLEAKDEEIVELKKRVRTAKVFQRFEAMKAPEREPRGLEDLKSKYGKVRNAMSGISSKDYLIAPKKTSPPSEDLKALNHRAFGHDQPQASKPNSHLPVGLQLQALAGAAVCDWVFKGRLRCVATMNTPILAKYRHDIRTIFGDETLRTFDFTSHQSVVDETYYKDEFLPRTAQRLVQRLLEALSTLLAESDLKTCGLRKGLESTFTSALGFKTFAMTSGFKCEIIWPEDGSVFDQACMEEAMPPIRKGSRASSARKRVVLVLVPGLRVYRNSGVLVDYCGFIAAGEEKPADAVLVLRAVVATTASNECQIVESAPT